MPCKSCGSVNQKKFSAEMGIHGSVWIVVPRNLLFLRLNCANSQRQTPSRQVNLELSLTSH
jgi:hypothetical protein